MSEEYKISQNSLSSFRKKLEKYKNNSIINENISNHSTRRFGYAKPLNKKQKGINPLDVIDLPLVNDLIKPKLDILFIGINPGAQSSLKQHHFAGPTNAFWPCLNNSGLVKTHLTPFDDTFLLNEYNYGFTNLVERPTRSSSQLSLNEMRNGIEILADKINSFQPKIACFLGKTIYQVFMGKKVESLGLQKETLEFKEPIEKNCKRAYYYVTPSTSGRAANFSRAEKEDFFKNLKILLDDVKSGKDLFLN